MVFGICYLVLLMAKKTGVYFPLISDYAADFICIPLTLLGVELFLTFIPEINFRINRSAIMVAVIYFSLVFEWIMPRFSHDYTADVWDVVCYLAGGVIFAKIKNYGLISA